MKGSPLDCPVCSKELLEPLLLGCQHTVCSKCVQPRCTSCRSREEPPNSPSSSRSPTPQPDRLAAFLLDASKEQAEVCANCDQALQPMFFCETCQQSLCPTCRVSTHQAKMFATHRIISADERNRVYGSSMCREHGEPYILYCSDVRRLVCIQCFNGRPLEERHSFISIENGHKSCVEKIEHWASKLRLYQDEKQEELEVRKRIIAENSALFDESKNALHQLCQQIIDTVLATRERLAGQLEAQQRVLSASCDSQIGDIEATLSPVRLCLLTAQILCTSASKIDVLQLSSELYKRIHTLLDRTVEKLPTSSATDTLEARTELAKAIEPYLGLSAAWCPLSAARDASREGSASYKRGSGSHSKVTLSKFQAAIDLSGAFGQLFAKVEHPLRQLVVDLALTSQRVLETQGDLTRRRCLIEEDVVGQLVKTSKKIEADLGLHSAALDEMQCDMQEIWQEQLDRVRRQQIIYREKIEEVLGLRETARQVLTAAKQLAPYVACIRHMNAMINPKRCHPPDPAPMESICLQISEIEPNSESRILAIEKEEKIRRAHQEAKKQEEIAGRDAVVKTLKHGKARRKDNHRLLVNTNRERSPGGTDTALISPCNRRISPTVREETNSELDAEELWDESFDFTGEQFENVDTALMDQMRCSSSLTLSVCGSPTSSLPSLDQLLGRCPLASRVTTDVGTCRLSMLQSLNDVFATQKAFDYGVGDEKLVLEERNVLASAVRSAERKRKDVESDFESPTATPPTGLVARDADAADADDRRSDEAKPKKAVVRRRVKKTDLDDTSPSSVAVTNALVESRDANDDNVCWPMTLEVPIVPFVPSSVFESPNEKPNEKLKSFEAKEKVLASLKEKLIVRIDSGDEKENNETPIS